MNRRVSEKERYVSALGIVTADFNGGQRKVGTEAGSLQLFEQGLVQEIEKAGWPVTYAGPLNLQNLTVDQDVYEPNLKNPKLVGLATHLLHEAVYSLARHHELVVTLGGDHSIAMGTVSATARVYPDIGVIWVDAHADINTPRVSLSGNMHGMPVAFLMGLEGTEHTLGLEWLSPCLTPDRLVYIGLRDVDEAEIEILTRLNIRTFFMKEVHALGINEVVKQALAHVNPDGHRPIHLSFDIDALDPSIAPSTGTPVEGGLSLSEALYICKTVASQSDVVALDLAEVNPYLATDPEEVETTLRVASALIKANLQMALRRRSSG